MPNGVGAFEHTVFHEAEVVTGFSLFNDNMPGIFLDQKHGVDDGLLVLGVQRAEHEVLLYPFPQRIDLSRCLCVHWWQKSSRTPYSNRCRTNLMLGQKVTG